MSMISKQIDDLRAYAKDRKGEHMPKTARASLRSL